MTITLKLWFNWKSFWIPEGKNQMVPYTLTTPQSWQKSKCLKTSKSKWHGNTRCNRGVMVHMIAFSNKDLILTANYFPFQTEGSVVYRPIINIRWIASCLKSVRCTRWYYYTICIFIIFKPSGKCPFGLNLYCAISTGENTSFVSSLALDSWCVP